MFANILAIVAWIISLLRPSEAKQLERTEGELAAANEVLKKVKTADDTKVLLDRISSDAMRVQLKKWQRD